MGTIYNWKTGNVGDWGTGADWGGGVVPNSGTASVTISGAGSDVTIGYGESFTVGTLTLGGSTPTLDIEGTLAFAGAANTLALKTGLLEIQGELANADIVQTGGSLVLASATLSGDTYSGTLNVDVAGTSNDLYIQNGITSSGGVINLSSANYYNNLIFLDSETFNNQTIKAGSTTNDGNNIEDYAGTLTLGAHAVVSAAANSIPAFYLDGNFVNQGLITAAAGGIVIDNGTFVNAATGTLAVASGTVLDISNEQSLANVGLVSLGSNATLYLDTTSFLNTGAISLGAGSTIDLQTSFGLAALGTLALASTATFEVDGTLDLGGGTLDVKAGTQFADVYVNGGTLENGFIKPDGGTLNLANATFDAISYSGTLSVSNILYIENGITATGGVINLVSPNYYSNVQLEFLDTETFDTQTIQTGGTSGYSNYIIDNAGTLTLGQHAVIAQGTSAVAATLLQGNFINRGLISAASSEIYIYNGVFTNAATGTIAMAAGTTLDVTGETSFVNAGLISIGSNGTFDLDATGFSNSGLIFLGAGSTFDLQSSLGLASFPSLSLSSTATFEVDGTLDLGGGTLDVAAGTEFGNVYVNGGTLANGFVKPDGGTLNLANATFDAISYSGTLNVTSSYGSTLYIENGITATGGVINLFSPNYYSNVQLEFLDTETFDTQTIQTGGTSGYSNYIIDNAGTLTLGQHAVIAQGTSAVAATLLQGNFINRGLISAASSEIYIYNGVFTNAATGTIAMAAGTTLDVTGETSFVNAGLISIGSNGTFDLGATGFSNSGLIFLGAGSTFDLQSSFGLASFPSLSLSSTATFEVDGTLDLGGGTLDVAAGTEFGNVYVNGGTLANGFVKPDGGTLNLANATFDAISYSGTLNVTSSYGSTLYIENGITATGGVINLFSPNYYSNVQLEFLDTETFDTQTIQTGGTSGYSSVIIDNAGTLTLGQHAVIAQGPSLVGGTYLQGNFINQGLISAASSEIYIYNGNFINAATGTIAMSGGSTLSVNSTTFNNPRPDRPENRRHRHHQRHALRQRTERHVDRRDV